MLRRHCLPNSLTSRQDPITPAISCLICGDVSAGVPIFSPPRLLGQEPRGQQRQALVAMPPRPVPHLVVARPASPLARSKHSSIRCSALATRANSANGVTAARHSPGSNPSCRSCPTCMRSCDEQQFVRPLTAGLDPSPHATLHRLDHQRTLLAIADLDPRPGTLRQCRRPIVHSHERVLGMPTFPGIRRRRDLLVADQRVRGHRQQVPLAQAAQFPAEMRRTPHLVIAGDPTVRQVAAALLSISNASSWRVWNSDLLGTPASFRRARSFAHSSGR